MRTSSPFRHSPIRRSAMRVGDVMTKQVETIGPNATVVEAARLMKDRDIGALPVCREDQIIGMITDRDIVVRAVAEGQVESAMVCDVMSEDIVCATEDDDLEKLAQKMHDRKIKRVPVLDEGRLVGIISLGDLA